MTTKIVDSKGRLTLGAEYASQTVLVDHTENGRIIITPAVVIPADEAWVFQDSAANAALESGLRDARDGRLSDGPSISPEWFEESE